MITQNSLTFNQLLLLHYIFHNRRLDNLIHNPEKEIEFCKKNDWITPDNKLTDKALNLLEKVDNLFKKNRRKAEKIVTDEFESKVREFILIFPKGKLPHGKPARTSFREVKDKLVNFKIKYPQYDWDIILDAATLYVAEYKSKNYEYMKTAGNFINKNNESLLADYCEMIVNEDYVPINQNYQGNYKIL